MRNGILLFGSMTADVNIMIDHWPAQDTVATVSSIEVLPGGPPQNCGGSLCKLAAPFPVVVESALGDDDKGDTVMRISTENGLDMSAVRRLKGIQSPQTQVMTVRSTGRRTFFYYPGANSHIFAEDFDPSNAFPAKIFYAGAPGLLPAMDNPPSGSSGWPGLFQKARAAGFKTTIEMVSIPALENRRIVLPVLPHLDYLVVNDFEAGALTGCALDSDGAFQWQAAAKACERLFELGVGEIVAIHHPHGGVAMRRDGSPVAAGSVKMPDGLIKSAVGAGDAFSAGFHYGLHEGWSLESCLELANAAAAMSMCDVSTTGAIKPASQCLDFARLHGARDHPL